MAVTFGGLSSADALDKLPAQCPLSTLGRIIGDLRTAKKLDRSTIERATHSNLKSTAETNSFQTYEAKGIKADSLTIDLALKKPKKGSDAIARSLFVINIVQGCLRKSDVEARYSPWKITDLPHGGSLDEQAYWTRYEAWGELSFGFAERAPDCLKSIVFTNGDTR